jgi:hypothetical protein
MATVQCPNCGQLLTIDEPGGDAYWLFPSPEDFAGAGGPTPGGAAWSGGTDTGIVLPDPPVALPNYGDGVVCHVPPCPTPTSSGMRR